MTKFCSEDYYGIVELTLQDFVHVQLFSEPLVVIIIIICPFYIRVAGSLVYFPHPNVKGKNQSGYARLGGR